MENVTSEPVIEQMRVEEAAATESVDEAKGAEALDNQALQSEDTLKALADDISEVNIDDFLPPEEPNDVTEESSAKVKAAGGVVSLETTDPNETDKVAAVEETSQPAKADVESAGEPSTPEAQSPENETTEQVEEAEEKAEAESGQRTHDAEGTAEGEKSLPDSVSEWDSYREEEARIVGGELIFDGSPAVYNGWDNLRWMSYSGVRRLKLFQHVFRFQETQKKTALFWSKVERGYVPRVLAVYELQAGEKDLDRLLLVLRRPVGEDELARLTASVEPGDEYRTWIVESVVDPATCKLQLSNLTHRLSNVPVDEADERARSVFEIISPAETIQLSAVQKRDDVKKGERSFSDSGAFFETTKVEDILADMICKAHRGDGDVHPDELILRHQGKWIFLPFVCESLWVF